jgi:ribosomal protein S18 acetylase RimI-like enzyme
MIDSAALAAAADANLVTHFTYAQRRVPGMRVRDDEGLVLADSGLPCDTFNTVCHARLTPGSATPAVRGAIDWFAEVDRPFSWWVGPADQPADLPARLRAAGLVAAERELAMAVDLAAAPLDRPAPADLDIRRVFTGPALAQFAAVSAANWAPPDPHVVRFYELAAGVLLNPASPMRFYVGYVGDEPVAASELTFGGGVAGLYNISTVVASRGRGFGTAMTATLLREAVRERVSTAILQAAPAGVSIYRRLGFATFGEIAEYKPALPDADEAVA